MHQILQRCDLHLTFLFDLFKCLMVFANLHFSSIIYCSCVMVTNWYSCWCIVPQCTYLISTFLRNNKNLPCALWHPTISLFTCSGMQTTCAN